MFFGVVMDRLPQTIILFVSVSFGAEGLARVMELLPAWIMRGFGAASGMMTAVGFAILTSMIWSKEIGGYFFLGFVLAKYLNLEMLPIAIIALTTDTTAVANSGCQSQNWMGCSECLVTKTATVKTAA